MSSHAVLGRALCNLWSGVMEWSLGVESWSGVLEWILEWNGVRFFVTLLGQDFTTDRQTATEWSGPVGSDFGGDQ